MFRYIAILILTTWWADMHWRIPEKCQVVSSVLQKRYAHYYNIHCAPLYDCKLPECQTMTTDGQCCKKALNKICDRRHYNVSVYRLLLVWFVLCIMSCFITNSCFVRISSLTYASDPFQES
jgi:hypothetical protein